MSADVGAYARLIRAFVDEELPVADFEREYLARFKAECEPLGPELYAVLNELFLDVDCHDPTCRRDEEDRLRITEATLRARAETALRALGRLRGRCWRVTKYDPRDRDRKGRYRREDWSSASEIGRTFEGRELTSSAYLAIEDAYVGALLAFARDAGVDAFTVVGLERSRPDDVGPDTLPPLTLPSLASGAELGVDAASAVMRANLREMVWCELEAVGRLRVRFGWDYYSYVQTVAQSDAAVAETSRLGLFAEPIEAIPGDS